MTVEPFPEAGVRISDACVLEATHVELTDAVRGTDRQHDGQPTAEAAAQPGRRSGAGFRHTA